MKKGAPTALPPGENHLNFSFTLPDRLPHSHEYSHGEVVYKLVARAVNSQPWSFNGAKKLPFTVLQRCDLRTMPQLAVRNDSAVLSETRGGGGGGRHAGAQRCHLASMTNATNEVTHITFCLSYL